MRLVKHEDGLEHRYHPLCRFCTNKLEHTPEEHVSSMSSSIEFRLVSEMIKSEEDEEEDE